MRIPKWRELIVTAENHEYFRGQIEFLLDFCGVLEEWEESGLENLSDQDHEKFQDAFEFYRLRAFEMFTPHGLLNLGENRWERALLTIGDYLLPHGNQNVSFLINSSTESTSWKRLLRDNSHRREFVKELWDNLPLEQEVVAELDELIDSATDLKPWIKAIVETPEAIDFCKRRAIRRGSSRIYLVKSIRLSGPHAELFTFCLYQDWKKTKAPEDFHPLEMQSYWAPSGIETEPGIRLHYEINGTSLFFDIEREQRKFALTFEFEEGDPERAELIEFLRDRSILEKEGNKIAHVERIELEEKIEILRKAVTDYIKSIEKDA